jgi:hypothetical protein
MAFARRAALIAATAALGSVAVAAPAIAEEGGSPKRVRPPGMERMHELMMQGNPGMERMHELMIQGNPGMRRMHEPMTFGAPPQG